MKYFIFSFIFLILMIIIDISMTKYAMNIGGFYETNKFTIRYGIFSHFIVQALVYYIMFAWTFHEKRARYAVTWMFVIFGSIHVINNIISIVLLLV